MSETPSDSSLNVSESPWDEIESKTQMGVVKSEFESWLHCLSLGKWLLHSVPEFPRVYKINPCNFIKHLLCAKVFYSCLVPQPALRRLELASSPPFAEK